MSISDPIDIDVLNQSSGGASSWTLPAWGNFLSSRVLLLATFQEGIVVPLGSGFSISHIGMSFTATHVIDQVFSAYKTVSRIGLDPQIRSVLGVSAITSVSKKSIDPIVALSIPLSDGGPVKFGDIDMLSVVEPTDIGIVSYGRTVPEQSFWDALPIAPMLPRIGSTVYCMGYCDFDRTTELTTEELFSYDRNAIEDKLRASFRVTKGVVTHVYSDKYSNSYGSAPCFRISCELQHGQSGGPVINADGYACGVNMSATLDSSENSCLASLIFPALGNKIELSTSITARHGIPHKVSAMELISNGFIKTDNSTQNMAVAKRDGQFSTIPLEVLVQMYQKVGIELPEKLQEVEIPDGVLSEFNDSDPQ